MGTPAGTILISAVLFHWSVQAAFTEQLESESTLSQRWQTAGAVQIDGQGHAQSANANRHGIPTLR